MGARLFRREKPLEREFGPLHQERKCSNRGWRVLLWVRDVFGPLAVLEATRLFQLRRRTVFPSLALASAFLLPLALQAQSSTPATSQDETTAAQAASQAADASNVPQSQQQRAQILREAQRRVMARRHIREQQIMQDTYSHRFEVYGGGGYLRFHPGPFLQHNTEVSWNSGFTDWIKPRLGVTGDVRGYYGTAITDNYEYQVFSPSVSQYTFMAGPQYRFFQGQHWAWNAQLLAGIGHGNFGTGTGGFPATLVGLYPNGNKLAVSVGAAVEYNLSPTLALRLMPNYLLTNYGGQVQDNLGFTAGVVYRFGRH